MNLSMVTNSRVNNRNGKQPSEEARRKGEVVHSGHFMMSSVADDQDEIEEIDQNRDSPIHYEQSIMMKQGYDFSNVSKETRNTYQFGPLPSNQITIDASLARLFQCMSLAYQGGKVVSPKWKNFKGLKLTVKDKIRLNNAIWRTWHIQYVLRKRKEQSLIQFATPWDMDYNSHAKPEAVVMEGKYWKRRIETVVAEYKKWRAFFMEKLRLSDCPGLVWVSDNNSPGKDASEFEKGRPADDLYITDFSDALFSSLSQQPFQFPNPREIAMHATNSDMIQPGLLQLQPIMDDYIEFDPFQDLINPPKKTPPPFAGSSGVQFASTNDVYSSDFNLESHIADPSTMTTTMNTQSLQSMDFIESFEMNQKAIEYPMQQHDSTADPIFSAVNINSAPFYPPNNTVSQQPHTMHQLSSTLPVGNQGTQSVQFNNAIIKQQHVGGGPQDVEMKMNQPTNVAYLPDNRTRNNMMNRNVQSHTYSKFGANNTPNKFTYSQPQITQSNDFNVQTHRGQVMIQPNPPNMMQGTLQSTIHQSNASNALQNQQTSHSNLHMPITGVGNSAYDVQQGASSNQSLSVPSNVAMLKQLLTNSELFIKSSNSFTTTPPQNSLKRTQTSPRRQQKVKSKVQPQNSNVPAQVVQSPAVGTTPAPSPPQQPPAIKRRSVEFVTPEDPWCQVHSSGSSSPVKGVLQDVDMELPQQDPVSPHSPDPEIAQMEMLQRQGSFSTEQKRRFNIKMGFTRLQKLLPGCNSQTNTKISKATLMNKAAQFIKSMQTERTKMNEEIQSLKQDLNKLKLSISNCQQQLPATGAPIPRPKNDEAKGMFKDWVRKRTQKDWKFFYFGIITRPWFDSYHQRMGSIAGMKDFSHALFEWVDQECSLRVLRPNVVQSLQYLSTTTNILTHPTQMKQQIEEAASDKQNNSRQGSSS